MRPTPIPDADLEANPGSRRVVIAPPRGTDDIDGPIRPVECLYDHDADLDASVYRFRIILEDGDLERLHLGQPIWISMAGHVVPWSIQVA